MNNSSLLVMIDWTGTYTGSQTTLKTSQRGGGGGAKTPATLPREPPLV